MGLPSAAGKGECESVRAYYTKSEIKNQRVNKRLKFVFHLVYSAEICAIVLPERISIFSLKLLVSIFYSLSLQRCCAGCERGTQHRVEILERNGIQCVDEEHATFILWNQDAKLDKT